MDRTCFELISKLSNDNTLTFDEFVYLIDNRSPELASFIAAKARKAAQKYYGTNIYVRGLIEISNYCKNDCFYCGIRRGNFDAERYRLSPDEILQCCKTGYELGLRTFVLQGGEDEAFTDKIIVDIITQIKSLYPDCAVTLSLGEKPYSSYLAFYRAGADRYLLRHETADETHFSRLHPSTYSVESRMQCLSYLKQIGYQVGSGFMVGSPFQSSKNIASDLLYLKELSPQMVGIGPFIPHHDTPFANFKPGTAELTTYLISIIRLMLPNALIPATTALGTIDEKGRESAITAGANVVMPNLTPEDCMRKYAIYDNKITDADNASKVISELKTKFSKIDYNIVVDRGDCAEA